MAHTAVQPHALSADSRAETSTRRLRTRPPRSTLQPEFSFDEMDYLTQPRNGHHNDRKSRGCRAYSPEDLDENSMSIDPLNPSIGKSNRRLHISRQHRVSTPPPLPSPHLTYLRPEKFPAWLLGDAMAKSSSKYMSQRAQEVAQSNPFSSSQQQAIPTSPVRRSTSSLLATSPVKNNHISNPLSRNSTGHLDLNRRPPIGRSISPEEALDRRREKFWEHYEYDITSPHLQTRYFDKELPTNEQWSDLDIQNVDIIPDPKPGPPAIHLFEVFAPTIVDPPLPPPSDPLSNLQLNSQHLIHQQKINNAFGFNYLPSDYNGHKK
ncbi:hypothetical protein MJO28_011431 [Puccinia striiformis f. sp. tritici]|uniref:Uncharacterized protein n=2 Tax=Puccinia striiformis f. sp. tritici TaxID=168172 RepID=A0A0L0VBP3_9BASI|nr:hypothetical protein Pst134EB_021882 [Puccinia striiformis f. sp. tritici]KAI7943903.1 hypothetical protein MJO28_011431 [Puccinia striiformis f. sp. tritici]KNE96687.1 hypothetical protein PSTG_10091 [Puccinia striiformis f. sp. tritici PST-78]KNE96688.1 hypothetical protein, variant [Puccinia striiformis f. sp. tritici PST-78]